MLARDQKQDCFALNDLKQPASGDVASDASSVPALFRQHYLGAVLIYDPNRIAFDIRNSSKPEPPQRIESRSSNRRLNRLFRWLKLG